eukprot:6458688-Pyramimonas_sp.AAC.1
MWSFVCLFVFCAACVWDAESWQYLSVLEKHTKGVYACCFAPAGSALVTLSAPLPVCGRICVWRTSDWACVRVMHGQGYAFSPDGGTFVAGCVPT